MDHRIGSWAFLLGVLIAIIAGFFGGPLTGMVGQVLAGILILLGLIVGFLNVGHKEVNDFLIAAIAVTLLGTGGTAAQLDQIPVLGEIAAAIIQNIVFFVAPAALVVALKAVIDLARRPA
jgi:hypothetical protein